MDNAHMIRIENLSKVYRQKGGKFIPAVNGINLSLPTGQVFGFLGPNGAGKTTTIKMICGLVRPTTGKIWVSGFDVSRQRSKVMQNIGAVLEGTRNIHWTLSAWENLLYFGHLKGMAGHRLVARAEALLCELELWDRRGDLVRTFSRGMQQKVAIACALVADPPIVLLDEPTLGLDVQAARSVKDLVQRLAQQYGKTIILTTHQLDMAQKLCERVAIIRKGRILADQPIDALFDLFRREYYEIRLGSIPPPELLADFPALQVKEQNEEYVISGTLTGSEQAYPLLDRLRQAQAVLISFRQVEPDLEEVFVHLLENDALHDTLQKEDQA